MKNFKKVVLSTFIFILAALFVTTSFAATADLSSHTYTAYAIFTGTQAAGSANLAVTGWGSGVNGANLLAALKASDEFGSPNPFASCTTAADVATQMAGWSDSSAYANAFARLAYENKTGSGVSVGTTLNPGLYLVADTTTTDGVVNEVKNLALLQLTQKGEFTMQAKVDIPVVIKKVKDVNDSIASSTTAWQDSADYDIGDSVPFLLKATLPDDLDVFPAYKLIFHDIECDGLTFDSSSVRVYIGESSTTALTSGYSVVTSCSDDCTFEVIVDDVIASGAEEGDVVRVEYNSTLNTGANIGSLGNPNEVFLEYSNNPNWSKTVIVTVNGEEHKVTIEEGSGEEEDKVYVDDVEVTDSEAKEEYIEAASEVPGGPYSPEKEETGETPHDKVIVFTYELVANKTDGTNPLSGADFTLYKFIPDTDGTDEYNEVAGTWTVVTKDATATTATSFAWIGVDDGVYKLVESTVPDGYTGMTEQIFTVTAEHDELSDNPALTSLTGNVVTGTISFSEDTANDDALTTTVVNRSGSTLPETGGIGTYIFYIVGGALLFAAVVLLITKKRVSTKR